MDRISAVEIRRREERERRTGAASTRENSGSPDVLSLRIISGMGQGHRHHHHQTGVYSSGASQSSMSFPNRGDERRTRRIESLFLPLAASHGRAVGG